MKPADDAGAVVITAALLFIVIFAGVSATALGATAQANEFTREQAAFADARSAEDLRILGPPTRTDIVDNDSRDVVAGGDGSLDALSFKLVNAGPDAARIVAIQIVAPAVGVDITTTVNEVQWTLDGVTTTGSPDDLTLVPRAIGLATVDLLDPATFSSPLDRIPTPAQLELLVFTARGNVIQAASDGEVITIEPPSLTVDVTASGPDNLTMDVQFSAGSPSGALPASYSIWIGQADEPDCQHYVADPANPTGPFVAFTSEMGWYEATGSWGATWEDAPAVAPTLRNESRDHDLDDTDHDQDYEVTPAIPNPAFPPFQPENLVEATYANDPDPGDGGSGVPADPDDDTCIGPGAYDDDTPGPWTDGDGDDTATTETTVTFHVRARITDQYGLSATAMDTLTYNWP